jgi:hypothetical protein
VNKPKKSEVISKLTQEILIKFSLFIEFGIVNPIFERSFLIESNKNEI